MERKVILFILLFCCTFCLYGQQELFDQANKAVQDQKYQEAESNYLYLLGTYESAELHHNLGYVYFQLEDWPKAILHFEKALKLEPGLSGAANNLALAKENIPMEITSIPDFFLQRWWASLVKVFSLSGWVVLQLVFLLFMASGIGFWLLSKDLKKKRYGFIGAICAIFLAAVSLFASISRESMIEDSGEGIIISTEASLLKAPDEKSPEVSELVPGLKVFIIDELGEWKKVRLEDREQGWIKNPWVAKI